MVWWVDRAWPISHSLSLKIQNYGSPSHTTGEGLIKESWDGHNAPAPTRLLHLPLQRHPPSAPALPSHPPPTAAPRRHGLRLLRRPVPEDPDPARGHGPWPCSLSLPSLPSLVSQNPSARWAFLWFFCTNTWPTLGLSARVWLAFRGD